MNNGGIIQSRILGTKLKKILLLLLLTLGYSSTVFGVDYFIRKGHQFADGTYNVNKWFMGTKLKFKAAFNSSNMYTIKHGQQRDSNKLFGISDCRNWAGESSARFGWRWYKNRLEITAISHYDGTWHVTESLGGAELNRVYDFTIELSEDKTQYLFTFNNEKTFAMKRDCSQNSMLGYFLYPFFGGSEVSPQDMTLSVWTEEKSNFAMEMAGPNPLNSGSSLNVKMRVGTPMNIEFQMYNMIGQLVYKTPPVFFDASEERQAYELSIPNDLSSGMYLIRPLAHGENSLVPGYVVGSGGESYKLIYLK